MKITKSSACPVCGELLQISRLSCPTCRAEFPVEDQVSEYDRLSPEQGLFLHTFLACRGNLKELQNELGISYPTAKKRLDELLLALGITEDKPDDRKGMVNVTMLQRADENSIHASDIIKNKLIDCGGTAVVQSVSGKRYVVHANPDGTSFSCDELPVTPPYEYRVFDVIAALLFQQGGKAKKGNGRNYRLGDVDCMEDTVVGYIAKNYADKKSGDSVYDPVFVLSAILDWAGIAHNQRGYLELTADYRARVAGR